LDDSGARGGQNHLHSSSDPWQPATQPKTSRAHEHNRSDDNNPFTPSHSTSAAEFNHRQRNYTAHSHQHSEQSLAFSSSSSHNLASASSSDSPDRHHNHAAWLASNHSHAPGSAPTSAAKHTCRGCSHVIQGRSLVDSSRRLTGRYHKECFVCTDCRTPFPSGDFYALDNLPYCAYDYHRRNGSLCGGCGVGVEGSYLQTGEEAGKADEVRLWHIECFRCSACGCVLRDEEYWELDGRALCTRDAFPGGFGFGRRDDIREEEDDEGVDGLGALGSAGLGLPSDGGTFGSAPVPEVRAPPSFGAAYGGAVGGGFGGRLVPQRSF
jgi:hypothetical protein